jgi:hypothetical protein
MSNEVLSVSEAMKEAGVFSQQIYTAISCGKLSATRENGHWRISRASFTAWKTRLETRRALAAREQVVNTQATEMCVSGDF